MALARSASSIGVIHEVGGAIRLAMRKPVLHVAFALLVSLGALASCGAQRSGCDKDTDCATGRICVARACVDRASSTGVSGVSSGGACGNNQCGASCSACPSGRSFCNKIAVAGDDRSFCGECPRGDDDYCASRGDCVNKSTGAPCAPDFVFRCTDDASTTGTVCDCALLSCQFKWN
jgi:hypothetical protein